MDGGRVHWAVMSGDYVVAFSVPASLSRGRVSLVHQVVGSLAIVSFGDSNSETEIITLIDVCTGEQLWERQFTQVSRTGYSTGIKVCSTRLMYCSKAACSFHELNFAAG